MTALGMPQLQTVALHEPDAMQLAEDLAELVERAQALTGASGVIIALRSYESLVVRTSDGVAPEVGTRIPFPSGVTGLCVTTRKPQTCDSDDLAAQLENAFRAVNARSVVAVPIVRNGEAIGVFAAVSETRVVFTRTHVAVLMTLADVAGSKLAEWPALWDVAPKPSATADVFELDVDSLLTDAPAAPTSAAAKPVPTATVQPFPAPPAATLPESAKEPAASAPATPKKVAVTVPISASVPKRASATFHEPELLPVAENPDVLTAAEDPMRHASVITPKPAVTLVSSTAAKPAVSPIANTAYHTPKSELNRLPLFAGCAAVLALGLGIAFYPRQKPVEPAAAADIATQPTPAPSEGSKLVAVPLKALPSKAVEPAQSAPAVASPTSTPATAKTNETARLVEPPKPIAEKPTPAAAPIELAAGHIKAKPDEAVASPSLGLVASSGKALPDIPAVTAPAAAAVPMHKQVTAVLVPAKRLQGVPPQFPQEAQRRGESGVVTLQISISAEGKVTDARVLSGNPLFVPYSIAAVRQWTYTPARLDGRPVESTAEVSLRFNAKAQ